MSYRCDICTQPVPRGEPKRRHVVKRADGNIDRELGVCEDCQGQLAKGVGPDELRRRVMRRAAIMAAQQQQQQQPSSRPTLVGDEA